VYYGNPCPEHYMTEQNGGGVALVDFDADGRLDVFFVNGSNFDRPATPQSAPHTLFRAIGSLRYRDVSPLARVNECGFGMGCAGGDYDNDGFIDLFVAGYGRDWLWRNNGDGTYSEVQFDPNRNPGLWGTSAAFADLDGDGQLDLYVVDYVDYSRDDAPCYTRHATPIRISCGPLGRPGQPDRLYHNLGDGRFVDASAASGVAAEAGKGLGLSIADFNDDGRLDVYVANDTTRNLLLLNREGLQFEDQALTLGVALAADGRPTSGMGVACGDYDQDGRFDLFVTNFDGEPNDFYQNLGAAGFRAVNGELGLDPLFRPMLGFGTLLADLDLDGFPDLFVANGHVWDLRAAGATYRFAMAPQLLRNRAGRDYGDVSSQSGAYFDQTWVGRGAAAGDLDDDGDLDLVITHLVDPAAILRNDSAARGLGVRLRLVGTNSARSPLGIRVAYTVEGVTWTTRIAAGDSFQSCNDARAVLSVGAATVIERIDVDWPDRDRETWTDVDARLPTIVLIEGTGVRE
jgi:hypothetical protein